MGIKLEAGETVFPFSEKTNFLLPGESSHSVVLTEDIDFPWATGRIDLKEISTSDVLGKFRTPLGAIDTKRTYQEGSIKETPLPVVPYLVLAVHTSADWWQLKSRRPILRLNDEVFDVKFNEEDNPSFERAIQKGGGGLRVIGSVEPVLLPHDLHSLCTGIALTTRK